MKHTKTSLMVALLPLLSSSPLLASKDAKHEKHAEKHHDSQGKEHHKEHGKERRDECKKQSCCIAAVSSESSTLPDVSFVTFAPNKKCVAVCSQTHVALCGFDTKKCGISPKPTDTLTFGSANGTAVAFSPDSETLVVTTNTDTFYLFKMKEDCCKAERNAFQSITISGSVANTCNYSHDGRFLAVSFTGTDEIAIFHVKKDGTISKHPALFATGASDPLNPTFSPDDECLACVNFNPSGQGFGTVSSFKVNKKDGRLCLAGSPVSSGGFFPNDLAYSPDGRFLSVGNRGSSTSPQDSTISVYAVNEKNCGLTLIQQDVTFSSCTGIRYSKEGCCLVAANHLDNTVSSYTVSKENGYIFFRQSLPLAEAFFLDIKNKCFVVSSTANQSVNVFKFSCCKPGEAGTLSAKPTTKKSAALPQVSPASSNTARKKSAQ